MAIHNQFFALKRMMENKSIAVVGRKILVQFLLTDDPTVGYTECGNKVYINPNHPIASNLKLNKRLFFFEGVIFHEWLHQLFTDFKTPYEKYKKMSPLEFDIWMKIANIMEDAAIEHFAPTVAGGTLLHSLRYASAINMSEVSKLNECKSRLSELFSALLQYGRRGVISGSFSDDEVSEIFFNSLDDFDACIHEPKGELRLEYATKVFERSRPIWENEAKAEEILKILQTIFSMFDPFDQHGDCGMPIEVPADTEMDNRRKNARKQAESKRLQKGSQNGAGNPSASDEKGQDQNGRDSQSGSGQESESDCSQKSDAQSSGDQQENGQQSSDGSDSQSSRNKNGEGADQENEEEVQPDEAVLESLQNELDKCMNAIDNEKKAEHYNAKKDKEESSFPFLPNHRNTTVVNQHPSAPPSFLDRAYSDISGKMQSVIDDFADRLLDLFTPEYDQRNYSSSGKLSVKRTMSGKLTVNMFTKNNSPSDKSDMAVVIMSDCSGSMSSGDKDNRAKYCLIAFAEAFGKLNIPVKIVGFCYRNCAVYHTHCSDWTNPASGRRHILELSPSGCNCDGYSIRYGTELLKNRQEEHKVLIVISDGLPSRGGDDPSISPEQDATAAVIEAKQEAVVIGVGIDGDMERMRGIYGSSFVSVKNLCDMFTRIAERLKYEIERW